MHVHPRPDAQVEFEAGRAQVVAIPDIAELKEGGGDSFTVTAKTTAGRLAAASLITVTSQDGQQKNIVLTVYPQPPQPPQ